MHSQVAAPPASLYELDETAWLEQTADLIAQGRLQEVDLANLRDYLTDMARRDKREVFSRLVSLFTHLLKWEHQPDQRSNSWRGTILEQQRELRYLTKSGILRRHAEESCAEAYTDALEQASAETGLATEIFPTDPNWTLDEAMTTNERK